MNRALTIYDAEDSDSKHDNDYTDYFDARKDNAYQMKNEVDDDDDNGHNEGG